MLESDYAKIISDALDELNKSLTPYTSGLTGEYGMMMPGEYRMMMPTPVSPETAAAMRADLLLQFKEQGFGATAPTLYASSSLPSPLITIDAVEPGKEVGASLSFYSKADGETVVVNVDDASDPRSVTVVEKKNGITYEASGDTEREARSALKDAQSIVPRFKEESGGLKEPYSFYVKGDNMAEVSAGFDFFSRWTRALGFSANPSAPAPQ